MRMVCVIKTKSLESLSLAGKLQVASNVEFTSLELRGLFNINLVADYFFVLSVSRRKIKVPNDF